MKVRVDGRLIKSLRIKRSFSQERLAELVGVNLRTVQRLEATGLASISTRGALAEALGVEPEELDLREAPDDSSHSGQVASWPRWSHLIPSSVLVIFGTAVLSFAITSVPKMGQLTSTAVVGALIASSGLVWLGVLTPLGRWRAYVILVVLAISLALSPAVWTARALVAISLLAAFELGILVLRLRNKDDTNFAHDA